VNLDGVIDLADLSTLVANLDSANLATFGDVNGDGTVDVLDLARVARVLQTQ
jgi:hypothetical protein